MCIQGKLALLLYGFRLVQILVISIHLGSNWTLCYPSDFNLLLFARTSLEFEDVLETVLS